MGTPVLPYDKPSLEGIFGSVRDALGDEDFEASLAQGRAMSQATLPFMEAFQPGLMALRLSTLGDLLLVGSSMIFAVRFGAAFVRQCRQSCEPWVLDALRPEPAARPTWRDAPCTRRMSGSNCSWKLA